MKNEILININNYFSNIRKLSALLLMLFLNNSLADRSVEFSAPKSMKEQVMYILMSSEPDEKILSKFLSLKEFKPLLDDELSNNEVFKENFLVYKYMWERQILEKLSKLHKKANKLGIDWRTVKVVKFPISLRTHKEKGLKMDIVESKTKMHFRVNDKEYYIIVNLVLLKGKYKIHSIYGLNEARTSESKKK